MNEKIGAGAGKRKKTKTKGKRVGGWEDEDVDEDAVMDVDEDFEGGKENKEAVRHDANGIVHIPKTGETEAGEEEEEIL